VIESPRQATIAGPLVILFFGMYISFIEN
jgi:hypothetical protein